MPDLISVLLALIVLAAFGANRAYYSPERKDVWHPHPLWPTTMRRKINGKWQSRPMTYEEKEEASNSNVM